MPLRRLPLAIATLLLVTAPADAQDSSPAETAVEAIFGALNLPQVVEEARQEGVSNEAIVTVLEGMRTGRVPAGQAEDVLEQEVEAVRAGGPVDNFGAFVQTQLASGLRGRELAAAIRAEHRNRGIGIPANRPERQRAGRGGRGQRGGPGEAGGRRDGREGEAGARGEGRGSGNGRGRGGNR